MGFAEGDPDVAAIDPGIVLPGRFGKRLDSGLGPALDQIRKARSIEPRQGVRIGPVEVDPFVPVFEKLDDGAVDGLGGELARLDVVEHALNDLGPAVVHSGGKPVVAQEVLELNTAGLSEADVAVLSGAHGHPRIGFGPEHIPKTQNSARGVPVTGRTAHPSGERHSPL